MESNAPVSQVRGQRQGEVREGTTQEPWGSQLPPKFFPLPLIWHKYLLLANGSIFFPSVD